MPLASVSHLVPRGDITRAVSVVSLVRYMWITVLHYGFVTLAFVLTCLVIIETFFDVGSRTSAVVQSHLWQMFGFTGASGGLGAYLKFLDQNEQKNLRIQQLLDKIGRMPDSPRKEKYILECIKLFSKSGTAESA
jgi:hypothetical protein